MLVALGQVQPDAPGHQRRRNEQGQRDGLAKDGNRQGRPHKRRDRKIGTRARRPKMAQAQHKQREARAIARKTQQRGRQHHR